MLLRLLLISEVRVRRRRWESVRLLKGRVLLCHRRRCLLQLKACCSGRTVIEKAALAWAFVAEVSAGVCIAMMSASALRGGMMPTANLAESQRAWVACAAQRRAGHVPIGSARVQSWMLILLLPRHLIDEYLMLLWLKAAYGRWLGWLLTPGLLLLLLRRWGSRLLLLSLLTTIAASASSVAVA